MKSVEKEKLIKSDIQSIENRVRHAFNQGYDLGYKDGLQKVKAEYKRRLELSLKDESRGIDLTEFADCTAFNEFIDSKIVNPLKKKKGH